jgi:hypothetical protein
MKFSLRADIILNMQEHDNNGVSLLIASLYRIFILVLY